MLNIVSKALEKQESKTMGRQFEGLEKSYFSGTGLKKKKKGYFQEAGKIEVDRHRRKRLTKHGVSTEAPFWRTIRGILSDP